MWHRLRNFNKGDLTMIDKLDNEIEKKAEEAEKLRTFSGVKLLHIKRQVAELLNHIGKMEIFSEYTKHDISHVDEMLRLAEWIIPEKTKASMTPAEWMMLVLAIYFHDMGMIVTKQEFENRDKTDFVEYRKKVYEGREGQEYKKKVLKLDNPDRFLYQEFVRSNHAKRINLWLSGEDEAKLGWTEGIATEIKDLMKNVDSLFMQDLAVICESHHLDNLYDYDIYDTNKYYESSEEGKVNLQYIAVILRTVDLLHITMDRTPATEFRVFCPTDPISIIEWQKQKAIRAIKPLEMRDADGNIDKNLQSDTIYITAYFEEANQAEAFFALMDYIRFARTELKNSYELVQASAKKQGTNDYQFPWRKIEDKGIKTKNFSNHLLKFELDQNNILQMLVGHTLYNDSSVVLRELVQNGLDAIKFQNDLERRNQQKKTEGKILVTYDEEENVLSFADNGTGMTVYEIENYLLRIGQSKYSSASFQKDYPDFVSISRFGIGILTCFLVADDIEIITCSSENNEANSIFFRNVDGKYLLKTMQKKDLPVHIAEHGTEIRLHLREENGGENLEYNLRKWIVFPYCDVVLKINDSEPKKIGFKSPKAALEEYIKNNTLLDKDIVVKEVEQEGIILAYALRYREHLQEYSLVEYSRRSFAGTERESLPAPIGVCFEGIRVASNTPGYRGQPFLAIMNSSDNKIVKTNVARSSVEENEGKKELLKIIYSIYKKNIEEQIETFKLRGCSLSWIASEIRYLVNQLGNANNSAFGVTSIEDKSIMESVFENIEGILHEKEARRQLVSASYIHDLERFNMTESNLINAAERLLIETNSDMSLGGLVDVITQTNIFPSEDLICDFESHNLLHRLALQNKTVVSIDVNKMEKKVDICMECAPEKWQKIELVSRDPSEVYDINVAYIPKVDENIIKGLDDGELGVKTRLGVFLVLENEMTKLILENAKLFDVEKSEKEKSAFRLLVSLIVNRQAANLSKEKGVDTFERMFYTRVEKPMLDRISADVTEILWSKINREELVSAIYLQNLKVFDLKDWSRREL